MLAAAAALVRGRQLSCAELVERALRLIEAAEPALGAVVALRAEAALAEGASRTSGWRRASLCCR